MLNAVVNAEYHIVMPDCFFNHSHERIFHSLRLTDPIDSALFELLLLIGSLMPQLCTMDCDFMQCTLVP